MKRFLSLVLIICLLSMGACATHIPPSSDTDDTTASASDMTEAPVATTAPPVDTVVPPETTTPDTDVVVTPSVPEYINPLTGLATTKELVSTRPVAIMLNNVKISTPQDGIGSADIIYECLAEGGITRLMMLTLDYKSLGVVGSVRSARDYFIDLALNHDAIFVHAGGSPDAYTEIAERGIENLDFVNGRNVDPYYYRDEWRYQNMGSMHSVVTTGDRLARAFADKKIRTEISSTYDNPLKFVEFGTEKVPGGEVANSISIPHSTVQVSSFVYDPEKNVYDHYQFGGDLHIDRLTGEKVSTANVIVLFCKENLVPNDPAFRINVETVGSGDGLYLYGGRYIPIKWSKASENAAMELTNVDGTPLEINRGKTFISIADTDIKSQITVK